MAARRLLLTPFVVFAAASAVGAGTYAAFTSSTSATGLIGSGSVSLRDNDQDAALLSLQSAASGASTTGCIRVTSGGTLSSNVRLLASSQGDVAEHLRVKVERGQGAAGFNDCSGFQPDSRDHFGLGPGVVFEGRLADLPSTPDAALVDPSQRLFATTGLAMLRARSGAVGIWELGERTRRVDDFAGLQPGAVVDGSAEVRGGTWRSAATSTTQSVATSAGRIRPRHSGLSVLTVTTAKTSELLSADVTAVSASGEAGLLANASEVDGTGNLVRYVGSSGVWQLGVIEPGGSFTVLDSWTGGALAAGQTARVALEIAPGSQRVLIDGVARLASTDTSVPSTGVSGVRLVGAGMQDDATGVQLDDVRSTQTGVDVRASSVGSSAVVGGSVTADPIVPSASDPLASASFDGASWLDLPADGLSASALTAAGWFRLGSGTVLLHDGSAAGSGWSLGFDDGSGALKILVGGQELDTGVPAAQLRGGWHHHALVRDGAAVRYYLDGRQVFSASVSGGSDPVSPWTLMRNGQGSKFGTGRADMVGLWGRALSAAEIAALRDDVAAPAEWRESEGHWYRVTATVSTDPSAQSRSGTASFTWEAKSR